MAKFSIIIPAYNLEAYITDCLLSVQEQSFQDFEVLVVDDGSTDRTACLAQEFSNNDNRFTIIHKENGGVSSARNLGLQQAKGEYIWVIDGDDYIYPDSLTYLNKVFTKYPDVDYITFHFQFVSLKRTDVTKLNQNDYSIEDVQLFDCNNSEEFVSAFISSPREACITCYNRKILKNEKYSHYRLGEDTLFAKKILFKSTQVASSNAILYYYFRRDESASQKPSLVSIQDYFQVCLELYKFKGLRNGWADVQLMRFCFETSLVDGMTRLQKLTDNSEKHIAYKSWLENAFTFLDVFADLSLQKKRIKLLRFTRSYWLAYLFFHIRYMPRRFIANYPKITELLRLYRIIPVEK